MEEIYKIYDYLPIHYKDNNEQEYINTLFKAYEQSYLNGFYQFAYIQLHMIFMITIYFFLLKIHLFSFSTSELKDALYYLLKDRTKEFYSASNTKDKNLYFGSFAIIKESEVFLLLKIIGAEPDLLGELKKLVKERNIYAHANGNVTITSQSTIDEKLVKYLQQLDQIFKLFKPHISQIYMETITESQFYDIEIREIADDTEQIIQGFVKRYFISTKELAICKKCELSALKQHDNYDEIFALHKALCIYAQ